MTEQTRTPLGGGIIWTGIVAALTSVGIAGVAVLRLVNAFGPGGVSMQVPVPASSGASATPSGAGMQVTQAIVTVPDPDAGLVAMTVGTILLAAAVGVAVLGCYLVFFAEVIRGRPFSRRAIRMLYAMMTVVILGTMGCYLLDSLVAQSVRSAAGLGEGGGGSTPLSYWLGFAIFGALGLIIQAFHRGAALQRETEGLV
ncbi:MAG: hypothetical protein WA971_01280 [Microbacterium sp.]